MLVEGEASLACLTLVLSVEWKEILTVEGLANEHELTPLQKAFVDHGAVQCGFCTPGMLIYSTALLQKNPNPDKQQMQRAISGNLCRCTGYVKIVDAIISASEK